MAQGPAQSVATWVHWELSELSSGVGSLSAVGNLLGDVVGAASLAGLGSLSVIAESWHILTSEEYQDLLEGQIEFQEI